MPSPRVVAVDSGAGHVVCGVFTTTKSGRLVLQQYALESFNPDAALEGQWNDSVGEALGTIAKREKIGGAAALTLPGHHTLTKFIKTPAIEKSKREKIIHFEAQQNIPWPLDEVVWGHQSIAEDGVDLEVLLAAAKLDVVRGFCDRVQQSGFAPRLIAPSVVALERAFRYNYPEVKESVVVANVGARSTNLLFIDRQHFFVRTIALAGNSVTQAIADEIKQDFAHAEALKVQVLSGRSELPEGSPARAAVLAAAQSFVGRLNLEITRSLVNYRRQSGAEQPACLYVAGGGSLLPELPALLAERLKMRVDRFDALRNVDVPASIKEARDRSAVFADLVGLAAQMLQPGETAINLLPPDLSAALGFRRRQPYLLGGALLVAAALFPPIHYFHTKVGITELKIAEVSAQAQPLRALQARNAENLARIAAAQKQITAIHGLVETKSNWINFFTDLQERLVKVEDVWLEKLQVLRVAENAAPAAAAPEDAAVAAPAPVIRLNLTGRLLDKNNPDSRVSQESYNRVKNLLSAFTESRFIAEVETPRFDNTQPGILRFDFILVVNPKNPL